MVEGAEPAKRKKRTRSTSGKRPRNDRHKDRENGVRVGYHSEAGKTSKGKDIPKEGVRMGYHSERANVARAEDSEGMRIGYHSERANPQEGERGEGMKMGYHSEAANPPDRKLAEEDGMRMGYHSEAANIGAHTKRLHKEKKSEGQDVEDENSAS